MQYSKMVENFPELIHRYDVINLRNTTQSKEDKYKNTFTYIYHSESPEPQRQKEDYKSSQREKTDFLKMKKCQMDRFLIYNSIMQKTMEYHPQNTVKKKTLSTQKLIKYKSRFQVK